MRVVRLPRVRCISCCTSVSTDSCADEDEGILNLFEDFENLQSVQVLMIGGRSSIESEAVFDHLTGADSGAATGDADRVHEEGEGEGEGEQMHRTFFKVERRVFAAFLLVRRNIIRGIRLASRMNHLRDTRAAFPRLVSYFELKMKTKTGNKKAKRGSSTGDELWKKKVLMGRRCRKPVDGDDVGSKEEEEEEEEEEVEIWRKRVLMGRRCRLREDCVESGGWPTAASASRPPPVCRG